MNILDFRPPRIAQLFIVVAFLLHWLTPLHQLVVYKNSFIGSVFGVGGFGIMLWAWWLFKQNSTPVCPADQPAVLVSSGIYRLTRHPMYLGIISMLLAIALGVGTLPFYLVVLVYFIIINQVFCPFEENRMVETFGDDYLVYQKQVRRWFLKIKKGADY